MKYIKLLMIVVVALLMGACSKESLDSTSIFSTASPERNEFDTWLMNNYTTPYNIAFNYLYNDNESNQYYNVIPAQKDKAIALAIMVKHIWLGSYEEVAGTDFVKTYAPRVIQLIGSGAYDENSMIMGTAEGGLKVMLYNVNVIDIDNPYIDSESPYQDKAKPNKDLNYYFFHTMHHEFGHILCQKKNYPTDFNLVSVADYKATDWINLNDSDAPKFGFVSGYASEEANEDFVEIYSIYVTHTANAWAKILHDGTVWTTDSKGNEVAKDTKGTDAILAKLKIVRDYLKASWNIDLDQMRDVVLRRSGEVKTLDLRTLK